MARASTPERAILAALIAPRPSGELVALDTVAFVEEQPRRTPTPRVVHVTYRARHPRERLAPEEREHRETYDVAQADDGRWEATVRR